MKVEILKQFSVFLPNQPGALSRVVKLFADDNINVLGIASEIRDDSGIIRFVVENKPGIHTVLTKGGCICVESNVLSIELPDQPGELYHLTKMLADSGLNITTVYGTAFGHGASRILIAVDDADKAKRMLEDLQAAK